MTEHQEIIRELRTIADRIEKVLWAIVIVGSILVGLGFK